MFPLLVLITALGLTFSASYYAYRAARLQARADFEAAARDAVSAIRVRMESYLALLRGGVALAAADTNLNRQRFHAYVERLQVPINYSGIQGIGYTTRVLPEQLDQFVARIRSEGFPQFNVWPDTPREEYHAITYLEPQDRRNAQAIGYDMFSEAVRRAAMERARDAGHAAASGKVELVQEIEGPKQAGFLIYVPVYQDGEVPETLEARRRLLRGFVYSPFRAGDLFHSVLNQPENQALQTEIYDGSALLPQFLLHATAVAPAAGNKPSPLQLIEPFEVADRRWTIRLRPQPGQFQAKYLLAGLLLAGGLPLTLLLFYLTAAEARARREAEESTRQLRASEQSLREAREKLETYARQLEERVRERTANLEQSLHSLEGVLYHVAHDLRAPLRAMASFTTILAEEYPESLDERGKDYVRRIAKAACRMDELVRDLLEYGRLGHVAMPLTGVSLREQVRAVLDQLAAEIDRKQAQIEVREPLPIVKANPNTLQHALAELVGNALKFVPDGVRPHVRIWAVNGAAEEPPGRPASVRLWIEDNGIGIQEKYHDRVFRIFERLHGQDSYSGTGIGLAIVSKAVERMGGKVGLESAPGQGSRFWVELPAA